MGLKQIQEIVFQQSKIYNRIPSRILFKKRVLDAIYPHFEEKIAREDDAHLLRFTQDKQRILHGRIEGWLVKNRLEPQHYRIKKQRDLDGQIKGNLIDPVVEFLFLVNNNDLANDWTRMSHFNRLMDLWRSIWNEDCISEIPDRDIGLFIKRVVYMNKVLSNKEKNLLNINRFNTDVFSHILSYKFKASNKELFSILKLPMSKEMDVIKIQFYDEYMKEGKNATQGFFLAFLEMNIPSSYIDYNIKHFDFVKRVVNDFLATGIEPDRFMTYLMVKVYGKMLIDDPNVETMEKLESLINGMFRKFIITNDLINYTIATALYTENLEMLQRVISIYKDVFVSIFENPPSVPTKVETTKAQQLDDYRFQTRLIDSMIDEARQLGVDLPLETVGMVYQLELDIAGYHMLKYHLPRTNIFISLPETKKAEILAQVVSLAPLVESHNTERLLARYGDSGVLLGSESKMTLDERFESGDFGAVQVTTEERRSQEEHDKRGD